MADIGSTPVLTTTEAVRAALGVDPTDISDQKILNSEIDQELSLQLGTWLKDWRIKLQPPSGASSEAEVTVYWALRSYCKWLAAASIADAPTTIIQLYGDGKAQMRRFTNFDWNTLAETCRAKAEGYKAMVASLVGEDYIAPGESLQVLGVVSPSYDPVTN